MKAAVHIPGLSQGVSFMKTAFGGWQVVSLTVVLLMGCKDARSGRGFPAGREMSPEQVEKMEEDEVRTNLAELNADDRTLAEQQRFCVIEGDRLLGSVGPPVKVMVRGRPVFVCCEGCVPSVESEPEKALTRGQELRSKAERDTPRNP
jgi:hypothetical protein